MVGQNPSRHPQVARPTTGSSRGLVAGALLALLVAGCSAETAPATSQTATAASSAPAPLPRATQAADRGATASDSTEDLSAVDSLHIEIDRVLASNDDAVRPWRSLT
jgi:hypothetical protein